MHFFATRSPNEELVKTENWRLNLALRWRNYAGGHGNVKGFDWISGGKKNDEIAALAGGLLQAFAFAAHDNSRAVGDAGKHSMAQRRREDS